MASSSKHGLYFNSMWWGSSPGLCTFKSAEVEASWAMQFHKEKRVHDIVGTLLLLALTFAGFFKEKFETWIGLPLVFFVQIVASSVFLLWVLRFHYSWFQLHRTGILFTVQALRIIMYYGCGMSKFLFQSFVLPTNWAWNNTLLGIPKSCLVVPSMQVHVALTYVYPLKLKQPLFVISFVASQLIYFSRCAEEVALLGQGHAYQSAVARIDENLGRWLPFPSSLPLGGSTTAKELDQWGACVAYNAAVQLFFGNFIPLAFFFVDELCSKKFFERQHGLGMALVPSWWALIAQHMLLAPLQSIVCFNTTVLILRVTQVLGSV